MLYISYPISWGLNLLLDIGLFAYAYNKVIRLSKNMREYKKLCEYLKE